MESIISSLPQIELYLLVGAIRLHIRFDGGRNTSADPVLHKDGTRILKSKSATGFNVEKLIDETEKITGLLRKKVSTFVMIFV